MFSAIRLHFGASKSRANCHCSKQQRSHLLKNHIDHFSARKVPILGIPQQIANFWCVLMSKQVIEKFYYKLCSFLCILVLLWKFCVHRSIQCPTWECVLKIKMHHIIPSLSCHAQEQFDNSNFNDWGKLFQSAVFLCYYKPHALPIILQRLCCGQAFHAQQTCFAEPYISLDVSPHPSKGDIEVFSLHSSLHCNIVLTSKLWVLRLRWALLCSAI